MKYLFTALILVASGYAYSQSYPCLKVTAKAKRDTLYFTGDYYRDHFETNRGFVAVTIENVGIGGVKLPEGDENVFNYEDDDYARSTLYFKVFYWDKTYGLSEFNHRNADIDYVTFDPVKYKIYGAGEKMTFYRNPFDFSGLIEGEHRYRVVAYYRIRSECGDMVFKSKPIDVYVK